MGQGSKFIGSLFFMTLIWGSYELYYRMRLEEAFSLMGLWYGALSVGCVGLGLRIARATVDD